MWKRWAVALLCAVVLAWCLWPSSLADLATSEQAIADRTAAAKGAAAKLAAAQDMLPGHVWRNPARDQICVTESAGLYTRTHWVWCTTTVTTYAGFTGDLATHMQRTDTALLGAGWYSTDIGRALLALEQGGIPLIEYKAEEPHVCDRADWSLTQRWFAKGQQPLPGEGHSPTLKARNQAVYRDVAPLDHNAVRAELLATHQYVAELSVSTTCTYHLDD